VKQLDASEELTPRPISEANPAKKNTQVKDYFNVQG
jgi:hypothetical protein